MYYSRKENYTNIYHCTRKHTNPPLKREKKKEKVNNPGLANPDVQCSKQKLLTGWITSTESKY